MRVPGLPVGGGWAIMGKYACRCPADDEGHLIAEGHDDRCPAGQLQEWARRVLEAGLPLDAELPPKDGP